MSLEAIPSRYCSGVDYYTGVCAERGLATVFNRVAVRLLETERQRGNRVKPWSMKGYEGMCCGGVQCGIRHDSSIVRLSGVTANEFWLEVYPLSTNSSRIDVQVTVWDGRNIMGDMRDIFTWAESRKGGAKARPEFSLIQTTTQGVTLYCGSRTSEAMGRCYATGAKHREPEWQGGFRAEIELKARRAAQMSASLARTENKSQLIVGFVKDWFDTRLRLPGRTSNRLRLPSTSSQIADATVCTPLPRRTTDCQRMLQVARVQWRRSARTLVSAGYGEELLECLGLSLSADGVLNLRESD